MKKLSKQQVKNFKKGAVALSLAAAMGLAGLSAFFTDHKTATNTFTVGSVKQEITEPSWTPDDPGHNDITPGSEFEKDPTVTNVGENNQYVFVTVEVPYKNIATVNEDGTKNEAADTELFTYTVNEGWTELGEGKKDATEGTVTHTYYYGKDNALTALEKDQEAVLFNKIKFVNVVEDESLNQSTQNVVVNSYGIQTTNLGDDTTPSAVWAIVQNQTK